MQLMSPHVLHVYPSFAPGGIQMRLAVILAGLPGDWRHSVLALDGDYAALDALSWPANVEQAARVRSIDGGLVQRILSMRGVLKSIAADLVITNNWGSIEWALAARSARGVQLIHTESGFGADEAFQLNAKRGLFRRWVLPGADSVLLCSQTLVDIARSQWRLPQKTTHFVPDGIDLARFGDPDIKPLDLEFEADMALPTIIGCVAPLRPEKNLIALLDAFHMASERDPNIRLAIAGDGGERARLEAHARQLPCRDKILFCGFVKRVERFYAAIDVCALSSDTEQLPNSVLQAMCARLPIVSFDVGDIMRMVSDENASYIVHRRDIAALSEALLELARAPAARQAIGAANARKCASTYGERDMVEAYGQHMLRALARTQTGAP